MVFYVCTLKRPRLEFDPLPTTAPAFGHPRQVAPERRGWSAGGAGEEGGDDVGGVTVE